MMISFCIKLAMGNHYYVFNSEIRRQRKGGATGNSLTMELSRMFGLWWDNQFLKRLLSLQVIMMGYWRYVDDNGNVLRSLDPGVRMVVGEEANTSPWMEVKAELVEQDKLKSEDERTAAFLTEVANTIHESITVKSDFPSKNSDGKMPLPDLKLWVQEEQIKFCFYSKEMSSKFFIPFRVLIYSGMIQ